MTGVAAVDSVPCDWGGVSTRDVSRPAGPLPWGCFVV